MWSSVFFSQEQASTGVVRCAIATGNVWTPTVQAATSHFSLVASIRQSVAYCHAFEKKKNVASSNHWEPPSMFTCRLLQMILVQVWAWWLQSSCLKFSPAWAFLSYMTPMCNPSCSQNMLWLELWLLETAQICLLKQCKQLGLCFPFYTSTLRKEKIACGSLSKGYFCNTYIRVFFSKGGSKPSRNVCLKTSTYMMAFQGRLTKNESTNTQSTHAQTRVLF